MPIITILIVLVVTGFVLWLINAYIPMQPTVKKILNVAVIIVLIIWLLKVLGVFSYLSHATV